MKLVCFAIVVVLLVLGSPLALAQHPVTPAPPSNVQLIRESCTTNRCYSWSISWQDNTTEDAWFGVFIKLVKANGDVIVEREISSAPENMTSVGFNLSNLDLFDSKVEQTVRSLGCVGAIFSVREGHPGSPPVGIATPFCFGPDAVRLDMPTTLPEVPERAALPQVGHGAAKATRTDLYLRIVLALTGVSVTIAGLRLRDRNPS